jgi:hypothetical protein
MKLPTNWQLVHEEIEYTHWQRREWEAIDHEYIYTIVLTESYLVLWRISKDRGEITKLIEEYPPNLENVELIKTDFEAYEMLNLL